MHTHILWLFVILIMIGEIIQFGEGYKIQKPFKFKLHRRPKPHYKPRWHPLRPHQYRYKPPPKHHYYQPHKPQYPRYPHYVDTDSFENFQPHQSHQPYVIEIELSKEIGKYNDRNYDRSVFYDDDFIDDEEDFETRVIRAGKKKVKIKVSKGVNPKLRIKISRSDNINEINDYNASEIISSVLQSNVVQSRLHGPAQSDWFPVNPPQIYLKNHQGT